MRKQLNKEKERIQKEQARLQAKADREQQRRTKAAQREQQRLEAKEQKAKAKVPVMIPFRAVLCAKLCAVVGGPPTHDACARAFA
jgi:regulator of protease activity HflC (stomatin/prohibitin superfamily)